MQPRSCGSSSVLPRPATILPTRGGSCQVPSGCSLGGSCTAVSLGTLPGHRNIFKRPRTLPPPGQITPPPPGPRRVMSPKPGHRIILQAEVRDPTSSPQPRTRSLSRGTSPQQGHRTLGKFGDLVLGSPLCEVLAVEV